MEIKSQTLTSGTSENVRKERVRRTKLADRRLPDYTRGEEIFNMTSHIAGGAVAVVILIICVITAAKHDNAWGLATGIVYGASMILLYTMSSVYHGLKPPMAKKVMQIIDHCTVYIMIAGTYTPILLNGMRESYPRTSWALFAAVWGVSIFAIILNAIDLKKFRVFSMVCYLAIGWCIIFAFYPLVKSYGWEMAFWLLAGGIVYTIGSVLYIKASKSKHRYVHSVFHLFVLLGSVLMAVGIIKFCMQ